MSMSFWQTTVRWSKKKFSVIVNDFECIFTLTLTFDSAVLDHGKTSLARTNNNNLLLLSRAIIVSRAHLSSFCSTDVRPYNGTAYDRTMIRHTTVLWYGILLYNGMSKILKILHFFQP